MKRDPRVDPGQGDEIGVRGLYWRLTVEGRTTDGGVRYSIEENQKRIAGLATMTVENWKEMFKDTEIVKVADE